MELKYRNKNANSKKYRSFNRTAYGIEIKYKSIKTIPVKRF